jgi:hypothetical protein
VGSIGTAFLITAGSFAALSVYGTVTKRDLSAWGTFLFMGLIGVVIASIVQFWWSSPAFSFALSCATVVVFAGLTAYDTQKLRMLGAQYAGTGLTSITIVGALNLYLDFINLFLALLRLFGDRRLRRTGRAGPDGRERRTPERDGLALIRPARGSGLLRRPAQAIAIGLTPRRRACSPALLVLAHLELGAVGAPLARLLRLRCTEECAGSALRPGPPGSCSCS